MNCYYLDLLQGITLEDITIISSSDNEYFQIKVDNHGLFEDTLLLPSGEYSFVNDEQLFTFKVNRKLSVSISFEKDKLWSASSFSEIDASYFKYHLDKFLIGL